MRAKKPMNHKIRKRIAEYRKTQMDISDLIRDYSIKGEDLSNCLISDLQVAGEDISDCNFTGSKVMIKAQKCIARNCRFVRTIFLNGSSFRAADLRQSNFYHADGGHTDYAYSDLRGANICGVVFSFASKLGHKAKVSDNIIDMLKKWWDIVPSSLPMQSERVED